MKDHNAFIGAADVPPIQPVAQAPAEAPPWLLFGGIFVIASVGGIAALLRAKKPVTGIMVLSAALNSGLFSLGISFVLYDQLPLHRLIGVSILCGVGGVSLLDAAYQALKPKWASILEALLTNTKEK